MTLVLASGSSARRQLLENAGISFEVEKAQVDERAIEAPLVLEGASAPSLGVALAAAKAEAVSQLRPGDLVIGADQVLATANGDILHKPDDRRAAAAQLADLAGTHHWLHNALALARDGQVIWEHTESARLTMRRLLEADISAYLAMVPVEVLTSSGIYQIEGPGIRLFEEIHGDFFAILGLPLLPLLARLRDEGVIT